MSGVLRSENRKEFFSLPPHSPRDCARSLQSLNYCGREERDCMQSTFHILSRHLGWIYWEDIGTSEREGGDPSLTPLVPELLNVLVPGPIKKAKMAAESLCFNGYRFNACVSSERKQR